jgi:hypothetical protein
MILCGMLDLCRLIVAFVIDLFQPRAAVEAEILVLLCDPIKCPSYHSDEAAEHRIERV